MSKKHAEAWREPTLGVCACSALRRTARAVTAMYDDLLSGAGITVTQYAVLVNIARADGISRTELAALLGIERTTLTRNLRPLEREKLVKEEIGSDRRQRVLHLTRLGSERLNRSFPLWEQAQRAFFANFSRSRFAELNIMLKEASEAAAKRQS